MAKNAQKHYLNDMVYLKWSQVLDKSQRIIDSSKCSGIMDVFRAYLFFLSAPSDTYWILQCMLLDHSMVGICLPSIVVHYRAQSGHESLELQANSVAGALLLVCGWQHPV